MDMDDLYQDVVLDHYKNPRGYGEIDSPDVTLQDNNPSCGDAITIQVSGDDKLNIGWTAESCAIATASASIMADRLQGKSPEEARRELDTLRGMLHDDQDGEQLGDLQALKGVVRFPIRIKCALLAWQTLNKALDERDEE